MPKELEEDLRARVNREHPNWSQKRKDAYVFGTLRKTGWVPSHQKVKNKPHGSGVFTDEDMKNGYKVIG